MGRSQPRGRSGSRRRNDRPPRQRSAQRHGACTGPGRFQDALARRSPSGEEIGSMKRVAILGGGPAGAIAAEQLASAGLRVALFDEKLAWEKPCGGGLTYKA